MTDFRAMCADLVDVITAHAYPDKDAVGYVAGLLTRARAALDEQPVGPTKAEIHSLADDILDGDRASRVDFARAILARWGQPAVTPPADGEVVELVEWLGEEAVAYEMIFFDDQATRCRRAADLLQRQYPQPVPVSEALPAAAGADSTQDAQIRRSILKSVESMDLRLLQRIAYEVRCEELGIHPDSWKLYPED